MIENIGSDIKVDSGAPRVGEPTPPKNRTLIGRFVEAFLQHLKKKVPDWLKEPINKVLTKARGNKIISIFIGILIALSLLTYGAINHQEDIIKFIKQIYQPNILISVIPTNKDEFQAFSQASLMFETKLKHNKTLIRLGSDADVLQLFKNYEPIKIRPFSCNGKQSVLYELAIAIQNQGDNTAKNNNLTVWFSSSDISHPDPEIRMAYVAGDGLDTDYQYQQDSDISLPSCIKLSENTKKEKKKFDLVQSAYREVGLTRDVTILKGSLEAHLFQVAILLIKVPTSISKFAVIVDVDWLDCEWGYKTNTYGQLLSVAKQ